MSLSGDLEALKPLPTKIQSNLDLIGKFRSDLSYLRNGKMLVERDMAEKGIDDETANKQLRKITSSINKLEKLIDEYEQRLKDEEDSEDVD